MLISKYSSCFCFPKNVSANRLHKLFVYFDLISADFDDLEESLDGNGNCSKSSSSKTSVKSCFKPN